MHSVSRIFAKSAESVRAARSYVADALMGVPADVVHTAALLVSELATNALLYSDGSFEVAVLCAPTTGIVRVGVSDAGNGWPTPRHPDHSAEHGRGLQLVAALSSRWGIQSVSSPMVKAVWFELDVAAGTSSGRKR